MVEIVVQYGVKNNEVPSAIKLKHWAEATLQDRTDRAEITLRLTDSEEMAKLNETFRQKKGPTNVLAFPLSMPKSDQVDFPLMGDVVICTDVVFSEAQKQSKTAEAHFAHMVVHGILHLLGYDHENAADACVMETEEVLIMKSLGFPDPYIEKKALKQEW